MFPFVALPPKVWEPLYTLRKTKILQRVYVQQLEERRRLEDMERERDRAEMTQIEYERHLLETREAVENEHELSKWKRMQVSNALIEMLL